MVPIDLQPPFSESPRGPPVSSRFEKPSNATSLDRYSRFGARSIEASITLAHTERQGTAASGSWRPRDIDWKFCFRAQHYGTPFFALFIILALAVIHWTAKPRSRPFFLYDASISYTSGGDTVPAAAAVLVPFVLLCISLFAFEFCIYRVENWHITNAVATSMHFLVDAICAFATVECFTEATKMSAGRLRPDFFQQCKPNADWDSGLAQLGVTANAYCTTGDIDGRKSFCSGHASTSAVIIGYNICYLIWAGYIRGGDAAFMGLDKRTGWRGGRRYLRELGHGLYLMWMLLNFTFMWAVGVSRFTDNKHNISDILGGWLLGLAFAMIYATRSTCLHKYAVIHNVHEIDALTGRAHTDTQRNQGNDVADISSVT
ncbi:hypothetical protein ABBQ32_000237 [Trebouxia sp. C0010 RCD-2024]